MKQRRPFDLIIIGADPPGLAAAACAARQHAEIELRVAVIRTGEEAPPGASFAGIPDFVWRRLELQDSALAARPVESLVSLFEGGRAVAIHQNRRRTERAIEAAGGGDESRLWPDFLRALERSWAEAEALLRAAAKGERPLLSRLAGKGGAAVGRRLSASCAEVLDDLFEGEDLKTHLASVALMPLSLAGDEPGSALALAAAMEPGAWRMIAGDDGRGLVKALEDACAAAGVAIIDGAVADVQLTDDRHRSVTLLSGETLRAPIVMAARAASPTASRLGATTAFSPLGRREGASAEIRLKLAKPAKPPGGYDNAVFFAAGSREALTAARDAALEGRVPEAPPIFFEFASDEILVTAPYCPAVLYADDERRDWTEQDRQALGRIVVERLGAVLNGAVKNVRRVEVKVAARGAEEGPRARGRAPIVAPPAGHDEIGAAARLAMELVRAG